MSKRGDPWFKFFPRDWLDGTRDLSLEQRGAYVDTICFQMLGDGPIKDDYRWLAFQMHISERKAKTIVESLIAATKLVRDASGIYNPRAQIEVAARNAQRLANSESALARWRPNVEPASAQRDERTENGKKDEQKQQNDGCQRTANGMPRARASDTDTDVREEKDRSHLELPLSETDVSDGGAKSRKSTYPDDFEAFWRAYPDRANNSKAKAAAEWKKLSAAERRTATGSLGAFADYCRAHPDYRCIHAERYIRDRRFEGYASGDGAGGDAWWDDPDKVALISDKQWRNTIARYANGTWPVDKLSPPPGAPGCKVPSHIVAELGLTEKYAPDGVKRGGGH